MRWIFEYYSQTVFTYSFTGTSIVLYILCLITTCVSKVTTHVLLNVFINFFGWLAFLALSQHKISLLQLYFKLSTTTFIYFQKYSRVYFLVFSSNDSNIPFSHWLWAIGLSEESWSVTAIMGCNMSCSGKVIAIIVEESVSWRTSSTRTSRTTSFH